VGGAKNLRSVSRMALQRNSSILSGSTLYQMDIRAFFDRPSASFQCPFEADQRVTRFVIRGKLRTGQSLWFFSSMSAESSARMVIASSSRSGNIFTGASPRQNLRALFA
jgi:hypothetical protein